MNGSGLRDRVLNTMPVAAMRVLRRQAELLRVPSTCRAPHLHEHGDALNWYANHRHTAQLPFSAPSWHGYQATCFHVPAAMHVCFDSQGLPHVITRVQQPCHQSMLSTICR